MAVVAMRHARCCVQGFEKLVASVGHWLGCLGGWTGVNGYKAFSLSFAWEGMYINRGLGGWRGMGFRVLWANDTYVFPLSRVVIQYTLKSQRFPSVLLHPRSIDLSTHTSQPSEATPHLPMTASKPRPSHPPTHPPPSPPSPLLHAPLPLPPHTPISPIRAPHSPQIPSKS